MYINTKSGHEVAALYVLKATSYKLKAKSWAHVYYMLHANDYTLYTVPMNEPNHFIAISVADSSTLINYLVDGHVLVSHTHPIGYKHIEAEGMNKVAASKFMDGLLYTLEFISLHDRIPTNITLVAPRYATWIGETIEATSYTQFFTNGVPISVTLEGTKEAPFSYARHSQTIHSFKV
jgi:hypothetical protein